MQQVALEIDKDYEFATHEKKDEQVDCSTAADFIQVPSYATLTLLREGKLPL